MPTPKDEAAARAAVDAFMDREPSGRESFKAPTPRPMAPRPLRPGERRVYRDDAYDRALLPRNRRIEARDRNEARMHARAWREAAVPLSEIEAWLRAGAGPDEADLVVALIAEGVTASDAAVVREHPSSGEWLTPLEVARNSKPSHYRIDPKALRKALDHAEVIRGSRRSRGA